MYITQDHLIVIYISLDGHGTTSLTMTTRTMFENAIMLFECEGTLILDALNSSNSKRGNSINRETKQAYKIDEKFNIRSIIQRYTQLNTHPKHQYTAASLSHRCD
jgi:hypothetical protein